MLQLLDCLVTKPAAVVRFHASEVIFNINSDALYLSESRARSRVSGHFMLAPKPVNGDPIKINGAMYVFCGILKSVVASAAEADLGHSFSMQKKEKIFALHCKNLDISSH